MLTSGTKTGGTTTLRYLLSQYQQWNTWRQTLALNTLISSSQRNDSKDEWGVYAWHSQFVVELCLNCIVYTVRVTPSVLGSGGDEVFSVETCYVRSKCESSAHFLLHFLRYTAPALFIIKVIELKNMWRKLWCLKCYINSRHQKQVCNT